MTIESVVPVRPLTLEKQNGLILEYKCLEWELPTRMVSTMRFLMNNICEDPISKFQISEFLRFKFAIVGCEGVQGVIAIFHLANIYL